MSLNFLTNELSSLNKIYASNCQITDLPETSYLKSLTSLSDLNLSENPVSLLPEYRSKIIAYATFNSDNRRNTNLILDDQKVSISELRTVDVIECIEDFQLKV